MAPTSLNERGPGGVVVEAPVDEGVLIVTHTYTHTIVGSQDLTWSWRLT